MKPKLPLIAAAWNEAFPLLMGLAFSLVIATAGWAQQPYSERPTYGRSHEFDLQNLKLELSFDLTARKILGTATLKMAPLAGDLKELTLDAGDLNIESVTVGGRKLAFHTSSDKLAVTLDKQYPAGAPLDFVIKYNAQPKRGLFFVFPDKHHPDRPKQIWANGDTAGGNNRYWFPCYDFPNDKTTTEMLVTVPAGWQVLSNGKLAGVSKDNTFHWVQDKPMSTYLISLVAGEFDKGQDKWTVPVEYYVPRGRAADIPRTFGRTVDMLQFFSDNIAPYPWAKYAQGMVDTFGGGMENTSATTEGASAILEEREFEDRRAGTDSLIAHEMAHQWFGDLVTCADWRHTWLNEGFATYFEALWEEHAYGRDVFEWKELQAARFMTTGNVSPASVVPKTDTEMNGAYGLIYNKGGWTLHMLRGQLGDAAFWKAIQHYAKKFSYQNATTNDFVEAVSEATGKDVEWLFDQYVYRPGYPQFQVSWDYASDTHLLHLAVKQTQKDLFHVPVEVEAIGDHLSQAFRLDIRGESQDFYFGMNERPATVLFDPHDVILKSVKFNKPVSEWIWQLERAPRALNREEAAYELRTNGGTAGLQALATAGAGDTFYGVRVEAAQALREYGTAQDSLLAMLADPKLEVRESAVNSLGNLKLSSNAAGRLLDVARNDASWSVRRAALINYGRVKPEHGLEQIKPFLTMDSPRAEMRFAATTAIVVLGDQEGVSLLLDLSKDDDDRVRQTALRGLTSIGRTNSAASSRLIQILEDDTETDRSTAIGVVLGRRQMGAIPALQRLASLPDDPALARFARTALENLQRPPAGAAPTRTDDTADLHSRLAELEKENAELKARIERLEKK